MGGWLCDGRVSCLGLGSTLQPELLGWALAWTGISKLENHYLVFINYSYMYVQLTFILVFNIRRVLGLHLEVW